MMESLRQDLKYALRLLRRGPVFTTVAVVTLAVGIGANTAVFSIVRALLIAPLPFPGADRLVLTWNEHQPTGPQFTVR